MNYKEKLRDPRWQKRRLEILGRDRFTCRLCGDTQTELHIHHLKYYGNPWDAPDNFLITYCKHCHGVTEFCKKEGSKVLSIVKRVLLPTCRMGTIRFSYSCLKTKP
jgi:hypothetical protein